MEGAMKREAGRTSETRELTDKELGKITSAMGKNIRTQSITVTNIIQANLKAEFAARRVKAANSIKTRKSVAT